MGTCRMVIIPANKLQHSNLRCCAPCCVFAHLQALGALHELKAASKQALQAARLVSNLATLTALSGHYRDALISMEALYWQQVVGAHPRQSGAPAPPRPAQPAGNQHSCTAFPVIDVTTLPDNHPSLPHMGSQLDVRYMDR